MKLKTSKKFLTIQKLKKCYPDEWLLLTDCKLTKNTELVGGKVTIHSKRRDDVYRRLPDLKDVEFFIFSTGKIPKDTEVLF